MTSILEPRDYYKPFSFPWAFDAYKIMQALHWQPHESPMALDIKDWNTPGKLTEAEKEFLVQLFRFFTQADVDVARGYIERYMPRFPHPEIRMMLGAFVAAEANHIDAYATLIETLGMPESEFQAFQGYKAMKEKHEYMFERESGKSIADLIVDIACFTAFGEGMQLFSSFALLMNFQRRGLMKGMTTIVEWSIRDETHHVASMFKLLHELIAQHPRAWNDETKKRVYDTCRAMVKLEDAFIDQAFSFGPVDGVTPAETKRYIRYIADRRLLQCGLRPNYHVKENPFPWLDWIMNAPTHTNFFEQRSTEYGKGGFVNHSGRFSAIEGKRQPKGIVIPGLAQAIAKPMSSLPNVVTFEGTRFVVYTKPDCPHCVRAKRALDDRQISYVSVDLNETQRAEITAQQGWTTFPMVYELRGERQPSTFIGGADALISMLKLQED